MPKISVRTLVELANEPVNEFPSLIQGHSEGADLVAAMRADSFLEAGEMDGSAVWRRVLKAIKEILREERREGEAVN